MSQQPFDSGLVSALTDFSVSTFATPRLLRVFYAIGFVLIVLGTLWLIAVTTVDGGIEALFVPLGGLFSLLFLRIHVEVVSLLLRMGADLNRLAQSGGGPAQGGPEHGSAPPPPASS